MRVIILIITFVFSLYSDQISVKKGWSLLGYPKTITVSNEIQNDVVLFLYKKDRWYVYPYISNYPEIDLIKSDEGFWLYSKTDQNVSFNVKPEDQNKSKLIKGWNLLSFNKDTSVKDLFMQNDLISAWKYNNAKWEQYFSDSDITERLAKLGMKEFDSINSSEGIWINANSSGVIKTNKSTFSYETQRDVTISLQADQELNNKQVLLFQDKQVVQTPVGDFEYLDNKLLSTTLDKDAKLHYTHTLGNHIENLWIVIPYYSIERKVQIVNDRIDIKIDKGGVL